MAPSKDGRERPSSSKDGRERSDQNGSLTTVLGSEEAAKQALLYSCKTVACGFSAKLTPEQVAEISQQPGVLQVVPSEMYHLHKGNVPQ